MDVDEIGTQRFDAAFELFEKGQLLRFDKVNFWLADDNHLEIQVESSWWIGNVDENKALADLKRARSILTYLLQNSPQFACAVKNRPQRFTLIYFDGRDAIELGKFVEDRFVLN